MKNYYKTLGIKMNSNESEIKQAFRNLAKKYHPDMNPNNEVASNMFKEIGEANEILSDTIKRAEYDKQVSALMANQRAAQNARTAYNTQSQYNVNPQGGYQFNQAGAAFQFQQQSYQQQAYQMASDAQKQGYSQGYQQGVIDTQKKMNAQSGDLKRQIITMQTRINELEERAHEVEEKAKRETERIMAQAKEQINNLNSQKIKLEQQAISEKADEEKSKKEDELADIERDSLEREKTESDQAENERKLKDELEFERAKVSEELVNQLMEVSDQLNQSKIEREYLQSEKYRLETELSAITEELDGLRVTVAGWEEFGKHQAEYQDAQSAEEEWSRKDKEDKKRAKGTYYGDLGLTFWVDFEQITYVYNKLLKRYSKKLDDKSVKRVEEIEAAFQTLSNEDRRNAYNESLGINEIEIEQERRLRMEYEEAMAKFNKQKADAQFWESYEELVVNAEDGDAESQNALGEMFYFGDEIDQDLKQAAYWFKESAKQLYPDSLYNLGVCLLNGEGIAQDESKGKEFIKRAAKMNSALAKEFLASAGKNF